LHDAAAAIGPLPRQGHGTAGCGLAFFCRVTTKELDMPLFFLIAIGAGAFTMGATAVDVTSDTSAQNRDDGRLPARDGRAASVGRVLPAAFVTSA